jgi:hypothetical protein
MKLDWNSGALAEGLRCYRDCAFFEAHEHWESIWLKSQEPEKTLLQAVIQVAAAFHHFERGNLRGAKSLLEAALRRLDPYPAAFAGLAVAPLRGDIRAWLALLDSAGEQPRPPFPQLHLL